MAEINRLKEIINREVSQFKNKAQLSIARAVLLNLNNSQKRQLVQIGLLAEEEHDDVERFEAYGFTGNPFPGAEGIALSVGGDRDNAVIVAMDNREHRPTNLEEGEACVYTDEGQHLTAKRNKILEVGEDDVTINVGIGANVTIASSGGTVDMAGASDFVALAAKVEAILDKIDTAFSSWTPTANDGGAALKTLYTAAGSFTGDTAATKVKAT